MHIALVIIFFLATALEIIIEFLQLRNPIYTFNRIVESVSDCA